MSAEILHQVVLLGVRRHRRQLAGLLLGDGEVALVDFDAVDLGDQRVLVLGARRADGQQQQRQAGGERSAVRRAKPANPAREAFIMALSLGMEWSASARGSAADLSPNNHGIAMAVGLQNLNVRVTEDIT